MSLTTTTLGRRLLRAITMVGAGDVARVFASAILTLVIASAGLMLVIGSASLTSASEDRYPTLPGNRPFVPVPPGAAVADSLIRDGETNFAHLWQITFGGENAEAYWSSDGRRLIFQSTRDGRACDQQYVLELAT